MSHLQEKRIAMGLTQPQVSAKLKEIEPRADIGMVSRYEKGVCLPTDAQIEELERIYGCRRTELYAVSGLDLLHLSGDCGDTQDGPCKADAGEKRKDMRSTVYTRKCFRVPRKFADTLPKDLFQACGYTTGQSWFDACLLNLLAEYQKRKRGENA